MNKKIYVCHANECSYNKQGSCGHDSDVVTIGTYNGGPAICPNFTKDAKKLELIEGMYQTLVGLLVADHGDEMEENIRDYQLYTTTNGTLYMGQDINEYLEDICIDNDRVVAIADAINVLKYGRVLKAGEC